MSKPLSLAIAFAMLLLAGGVEAVERPVAGTGVVLDVPTNFTPGTDFTGWWLAASRVSLVALEQPGAAESVQRQITREALALRGMQEINRQQARIDGRPALVLTLRQLDAGVEFVKWLAVFGDQRTTVMVTATVPATLEPRFGPVLRAAVLSARWNGAAPAGTARPREMALAMRLGSQEALRAWHEAYVPQPEHKAFAVTNDGVFGYSTARPTSQAAAADAMATCDEFRTRNAATAPCRLVHAQGRWIDDDAAAPAPVPPPRPAAQRQRCIDRHIAAFRKEMGPDRLINADQIAEWDEQCGGGR